VLAEHFHVWCDVFVDGPWLDFDDTTQPAIARSAYRAPGAGINVRNVEFAWRTEEPHDTTKRLREPVKQHVSPGLVFSQAAVACKSGHGSEYLGASILPPVHQTFW